ncbi:MAG: hypothetical protein NXH91_17140 [Phyllobacteriaceae bacterium]|nr:hypothetical protein [Phyllobacteriaceae bacterium]
MGQELFAFQFGDTLFIGPDDRVAARFDDAVEQLVDLLFGFGDLRFQRVFGRCCFAEAQVPCVVEHGLHEAKQAL